MKFVLFVEGHTERKVLPQFLKRWLDPRLPTRTGIKTVRFEGWHHYRDEIGKKVSLNLGGKSGADVIAGIGLLDLYGPTFYPASKVSAADRFHWAKSEIEREVNHPRFRQHFAVHETEAWLLSDPAVLPNDVRRALPGASVPPEQVDFGEPPAKLLDRLYRKRLSRPYRKIVDGANLFAHLDPERAVKKCPYLKLLLDDMLHLATNRA